MYTGCMYVNNDDDDDDDDDDDENSLVFEMFWSVFTGTVDRGGKREGSQLYGLQNKLFDRERCNVWV